MSASTKSAIRRYLVKIADDPILPMDELRPNRMNPVLLCEFACDLAESQDVRRAALLTLAAQKRIKSDILRAVIDIIRLEAAQPSSTLLRPAFELLQRHTNAAVLRANARTIESAIRPDIPRPIRLQAIQMLGRFGEVDVIERVCMSPIAGDDIDDVGRMVTNIIRRPRRVRRLSPANFELLVARVLANRLPMFCWRVVGGSGDGAIDIEGFVKVANDPRPALEVIRRRLSRIDINSERIPGTDHQVPRVCVQCKRRAKHNPMDVVDFGNRAHEIHPGCFRVYVTTARIPDLPLHLQESLDFNKQGEGVFRVDGSGLQRILENYAPGSYTVFDD